MRKNRVTGAQKEMSHKHDLLQALLNNIPDYVYFKDRNRRFIRASKAFCDLFNRSLDDIIGKTDEDLFPAEVAKETIKDDLSVIESGVPIINKSEGGESVSEGGHWVLTTKVPWYDREGNIVGLFGISKDITEYMRTLESLRRSEIRFRALAEQTTEAIFCYEYDPPIPVELPVDEQVKLLYDGTLAECNDVCARAYGASGPEEVIGKKLTELFGTKTGSLDKLFTDVIKGNYHIVDGQGMEILPDGSRRYYLNNGRGVVRDGKLLSVWGTVRDITDRKKLEEELLRSQKLESIGTLAGGIAHDLNNLLIGVVGNISCAGLCEDSQEKEELLAEAEKAAMQIKDLTQQLLTFSKGGMPVKHITNIGNLLMDSVIFAIRGSNVESNFAISSHLWPAEVDEGQIRQLVNNLVINAKQSMPEGGTIRLSAENITIGTESNLPLGHGPYIKVSIEDQGVGIKEEHLQKVFDPFFTTKQSGSGLGLSTSYSIIQKHNGYITVDSRVGVGTTFLLYIPASPEANLVEREEKKKLMMASGRILLMDDEEKVRETAEKMLASLGHSVSTVKDGAEALDAYKKAMELKEPFHAVILDLTVPGGMGGRKAIQRLRELDPDVKAIVSSGYSNDPVMADFKKSGFIDILPKPYSTRELGEVLKGIVGNT